MKLSSGDAKWTFLEPHPEYDLSVDSPRISCMGERIDKQPSFNIFREFPTAQERPNLSASFSLEYPKFGYGNAFTKTTHCGQCQ